jgi:hypothetical protein
MGDCILLPEQYGFLWKTSWISLATFFYMLYKGRDNESLLLAAIFLTSINYWQRPDYSWRRYMDIATVWSSLAYGIVTTRNAEYRVAYYAINSLAIWSFVAGGYYYKKNRWWTSTLLHANVHLLGNLAIWVVISG